MERVDVQNALLKRHFAIPVQITRETAKTGYRLYMYDDEPRFNSTLLQLLRQDFELDISGLNPLPRQMILG